MTKRIHWLAFCFLVVAVAASAAGEYELSNAKAALDRGDFIGARDQFRYVANNQYYDSRVRREAAYFIGFACVRASDPWGAIEAFERFLSAYQSTNSSWLIPDALFVLGRTYENVGRIDDARRLYRRCIDNYSGEFVAKCQDRLRVIGGGHHPPPPPPPGPGYGVSPDIADMIELAKMEPKSPPANQTLLKAARRARTGADFVAISRATRNQYTQWEIFSVAMQSRAFRSMIPYEAVDLAKTTSNSYYRNQVLLEYANKVARSAEDFRIIAEAAADSFTKSQILAIAREKLGNGGFAHYSMMETSVQRADQGPAPKVVKSASDPFAGDFQMDQQKVRRVNWFVDAVKTKKHIETTSKQLTKEDMSLDVVRSALKSADTMKTFDTLHQK